MRIKYIESKSPFGVVYQTVLPVHKLLKMLKIKPTINNDDSNMIINTEPIIVSVHTDFITEYDKNYITMADDVNMAMLYGFQKIKQLDIHTDTPVIIVLTKNMYINGYLFTKLNNDEEVYTKICKEKFLLLNGREQLVFKVLTMLYSNGFLSGVPTTDQLGIINQLTFDDFFNLLLSKVPLQPNWEKPNLVMLRFYNQLSKIIKKTNPKSIDNIYENIKNAIIKI